MEITITTEPVKVSPGKVLAGCLGVQVKSGPHAAHVGWLRRTTGDGHRAYPRTTHRGGLNDGALWFAFRRGGPAEQRARAALWLADQFLHSPAGDAWAEPLDT